MYPVLPYGREITEGYVCVTPDEAHALWAVAGSHSLVFSIEGERTVIKEPSDTWRDSHSEVRDNWYYCEAVHLSPQIDPSASFLWVRKKGDKPT